LAHYSPKASFDFSFQSPKMPAAVANHFVLAIARRHHPGLLIISMSGRSSVANFPVPAGNFPVIKNNFPVSFRREFA
jgi:hypothetical protein